MVSIRACPESRKFYDRKRAEGKKHTQAALALARRRINVMWHCCATTVPTSQGPLSHRRPSCSTQPPDEIRTGQLQPLDKHIGKQVSGCR
jgi:hypothetical protein